MKNYNLQDFTSYFNQFSERLERYRNNRKAVLIRYSVIAVLLVVLLPWYATGLAEALNKAAASMAGGEWKEHASTSDVIAIVLAVIAVSIFLILWPIFSYRGNNKAAGLVPRGYSFKDYVYSHLLKYFGDFQFAPEGGLLARDIGRATIIPHHHVHTAEDYIQGILHDCTVKIAETEIAKSADKERVQVFKGLMIVIDICDSRVKLRGNFEGTTVLIADAQKDINEIASRYTSYQKFHLDGPGFEEKFEAFTTNPEEANKLLSPDLIQTLLALQDHVTNLKEQQQHWDDKVVHAAQAMLDHIKPPSLRKSPAEKAYDEIHDTGLDLTKENSISPAPQYINRHVQAEFYGDKVLITLPFKHDLFEPNSLFEPAIHDEDRMLLFTLMQGVEQITAQLKAYFESR